MFKFYQCIVVLVKNDNIMCSWRMLNDFAAIGTVYILVFRLGEVNKTSGVCHVSCVVFVVFVRVRLEINFGTVVSCTCSSSSSVSSKWSLISAGVSSEASEFSPTVVSIISGQTAWISKMPSSFMYIDTSLKW